MNDLERDLKELFETRSGDVQTTPLAPPAVLRRGRRRQVGTVVGGALMAVAAAAVVIGGASVFLTDRAETPPMGSGDVLPARTAMIGGVTVTAPEGWSLLDQWPLGMNVTTETCTSTFEGQGTPVGEGAGSDDPIETPPTEECTPVDLPGGVPLFTLANVEPNPLQTVCEVIPELGVQGVGSTDAYLYVALDPNPADPEASWPADLETGQAGTCGTAEQARWVQDGVGYLAAVAIGAEASQEDRDAVLTAFKELTFTGPPQPSDNTVIGYVLASGVEDGMPWRLEAGPNVACPAEDAACRVQIAAIAGGDEAATGSASVAPPSGSPFSATTLPLGTTTLVFGGMTTQVSSIEVTTTDGGTVTPATAPWPMALESFAAPDVPVDGRIWWAVVPGVGSVKATLEDGTTVSVDDRPGTGTPSPATEVGDLRLETQEDGNDQVATMDVFGGTLEIRVGPEGPVLSMTGADPLGFSMIEGSGTQHDVPGGTLVLWQSGPEDGPVSVTVDGTGETIVGRWLPVTDNLGNDGRLWIVPLPGVGSGLERHGPDDLASAISWPTERDPAAGVVVAGGDNGEGVTWKIAYTDPGCLVAARVDGDPSIGQTDCLTPVSDVPLVAHARGERRSLLAIVIPGDVHGIYAGDLDAPSIYGQCVQPDRDPAWDGRSVCAVLVPNGRTVELQATTLGPGEQDETQFGDPITVRVEDGRLVLEG